MHACYLQETWVFFFHRNFGFEPKDHLQLGEALDLMDFEAAAVVSGSKFYYLRNAGALLEVAIANWALQVISSAALGFCWG
jgi:seryl-tRNA synthetase